MACPERDIEEELPTGTGPRTWVRAFWFRAYHENVTGLSAMVSYNLLLAVFPFSLLVLFIFSQVLRVEGIESSVYQDLRLLFPQASEDTLRDVLSTLRSNSAAIGVLALAASIWIGASFWGAMDTAFCRIYHVKCRGWWEQKRFSLSMLLVVIAFILASVVLPAVEGAILGSAENLPFGLNEVQAIDDAGLLALTLLLNFAVCSLIFWLVPKGHMPWRAVWPGALFTTAVSGLANWIFPLYLDNISTLNLFGSTAAFVLIALVWFYIVSLTLLAGAVINSIRHEYGDTGAIPFAPEEPEAIAALPTAEPYRSLVIGGNGRNGRNGNGSEAPSGGPEGDLTEPVEAVRSEPER
ncbi:MAG: YihY/virulence factor BrkB family protein [Solirubrobacterales bacterium]